jgi:preprotein translocase subunit SecF
VLQRAIGIAIGAIVAFILLWLLVGGDDLHNYAIALVVGGICAFFWPVVIGIWLGRRAKARQQSKIESEVQRQLDEERRRSA